MRASGANSFTAQLRNLKSLSALSQMQYKRVHRPIGLHHPFPHREQLVLALISYLEPT